MRAPQRNFFFFLTFRPWPASASAALALVSLLLLQVLKIDCEIGGEAPVIMRSVSNQSASTSLIDRCELKLKRSRRRESRLRVVAYAKRNHGTKSPMILETNTPFHTCSISGEIYVAQYACCFEIMGVNVAWTLTTTIPPTPLILDPSLNPSLPSVFDGGAN